VITKSPAPKGLRQNPVCVIGPPLEIRALVGGSLDGSTTISSFIFGRLMVLLLLLTGWGSKFVEFCSAPPSEVRSRHVLTLYLVTGRSLSILKEREHMALTIGQVAKAAHVNVETLRYYERLRIILKPPRSLSVYRDYPEDTPPGSALSSTLKRWRSSLEEIRELLSLPATRKTHCADVKRRAEAKINEIGRRSGRCAQ
jgi:DNA-binding transcriptional MerR regulator